VFGIAAHLLLGVRRNQAPVTAPLHSANLAEEEALG
jgi:hypothetical protein